MWDEARGLRHALDNTLKFERAGRAVDEPVEIAREARQNPERRFRERLDHSPHQEHQPLGKPYDRVQPQKARPSRMGAPPRG
jgi:hypothetical protein